MSRSYWVYILANVRGERPVLYVGVTSNIDRRLTEHRRCPVGFVARYRLTTLVYLEVCATPETAIAREKQLKVWTRARKIALIRRSNPTWQDLAPE